MDFQDKLHAISEGEGEVNISNMFLTNDKMKQFANAIGKSGKVKTLIIDGCRITNHDVILLSASIRGNSLALSGCPLLEVLELAENDISDTGVAVLATCIRGNLQVLDLSDNKITCTGAVALADGLSDCQSLRYLDLSINKISDRGAVALAGCQSLQELDISNNEITDIGAVALAVGMQKCPSLRDLYICRNLISDTGAIELATCIRWSFQNMYITGNDITDTGYFALVHAFLYQGWRNLFYNKNRWYGCTFFYYDIDRCDTWREQSRLLDPWRAVVYCASSKSTGKKIQKWKDFMNIDGDRAIYVRVAMFLAEV